MTGREATLLRVEGIAKSFGSTQAVREASLDLRSAEVHVLVGENGCGKSTLVKILSGVHAPDRGSIEIEGQPAPPLSSPSVALRAGVCTVFQEVLVAEARSVLDNVWLGSDGAWKPGGTPAREKRSRAEALLTELIGEDVGLGTPVEDLPLSQRQACCIVRAVLRRPRILILDEATSALDVSMRDRLFAMLERLRGQGVGVIFITHRMDEIVQIGDRVTVMRSGRTVTTLDRQEVSPAELVRLMTGGDQLTEHQREGVTREAGRCVLRTNGITLAPGRAPIDFELRSGELVGVAGLEGHGQEAFLDALRGVRMPAGEVAIESEDGGRTPLRSRRHAAAQGIAYVPRERRQATFAWMSIVENFGMPTLRRDSTLGWLAFGRTRRRLEGYVDDLSITVGDKGDRITTLSGGNMQKVVIARWLASEPRVLLLNDPTRGIDIGAKRDLYSVLLRLTADGIAVVMLSTEVDEHIELMDRVLVFREHQLFCELERSALGRDSLVSAFFGQALAEA